MSAPAPITPFPPTRRPHRAPRRSDLRIVCPCAGEVLVGLAVRMQLADLYASLAAVETNPQRRECLVLWAAGARGES